MISPGRDSAVISRAASSPAGGDAEGNAVDAPLATVWTGRGTWGSPSASDIALADARGEQVNAVLAVGYGAPAQINDFVDVRGNRYAVTSIMDVRLHNRLFLRRVQG